ncbi:MAG: SulP family inorganic anion transporter [Patescibacteria group bacterium]
MNHVFSHLKKNWKSGITVALISVPLSIALSVASGAGPIPGVITGIWATLIAGFFGGSNYNVVGAAGALTTVLFAATLAAPLGLGALILPVIAIVCGILIFIVWAIGADRFLYYIPSSVMHGFAAGVALLIAASQLFDATGLSALKRTGSFLGDIGLYMKHAGETHVTAAFFFFAFLAFILLWKRWMPRLPAVIPAAILGILSGWIGKTYFPAADIFTLGDKFGSFSASLIAQVPWEKFPQLFSTRETFMFLLGTGGTVALIAVLETLITAKIGDKITKTQSSSRRELFGLALANIGSGVMGGLPATGVFIRAGANIKAGATHRTSSIIAAAVTGLIALIALPYFVFIPMAVIAAILVNTALGLIEVSVFIEFFKREKQGFLIAVLVLLITILEDAGIAVLIGAVLSLLFFADRVSHGYFDVIFNFCDGTKDENRRAKILKIPEGKEFAFVTYSIAGFLGYIDSGQHAANLRHMARTKSIPIVMLRLRNLFGIDYEGENMLVEAIENLRGHGKKVFLTSGNTKLLERLKKFPTIQTLYDEQCVFTKSEEAIRVFMPSWKRFQYGGDVS